METLTAEGKSREGLSRQKEWTVGVSRPEKCSNQRTLHEALLNSGKLCKQEF